MTADPSIATGPAGRVLDLASRDPQLQQLMPDAVVTSEVTRLDQTLTGIVSAILAGYSSRPALGERRYEVGQDDAGRNVRRWLPEFEDITYTELERRVRAVVTVWQHDRDRRVLPGEAVCVLGFASTDYATLDLACALAQAMAVPLQTSLAGQDLERIIIDTEPVVIAASVADLVIGAEFAARQRSVRTVIAFDLDLRIDADREEWTKAESQLAGSATTLMTIDDLVAAGSGRPWEPLAPLVDPERMALLIHSSGSTGTPKGAIVTERHARFQFTNIPSTPLPTVRLCFAPLNHFMGRGAVFNTLARGGTAYFTANADMSTLFEDWRLVRPTEAVVFPRVLEMVYRHFLGEVARLASADPTADPELLRQRVMNEMRYTYLGDRICSLFGGSAPLTPEIRDFIKACFPVAYAEGYGTTEAGGSVTVRDRINRSEVLDYRLRDVPELGYFASAKPYPRGELCVKTRLAIPGYFKNPEATAALYDEDGFLRTGDIMEERGPDHLVYIDRRNDVLKLAQGEFVTLGAVGTAFETHSDVVRQIFVYGNSARAFLLAVVVPDAAVLENRLGTDRSEARVKELIRGELARVAHEQAMRSFEVPRDFIVETEPFSQQNGLLSSVSKRLRPRLLERYGGQLEKLYEDLERKQRADLVALRDHASGLTVLERVGRALAATLSLDEIDTVDRRSFAEYGGDSLSAASFAALLSDIFGVDVDLNLILSPTGHPQAWAAAIERTLGSAAQQRPTARSVHGEHARRLSAADLDIVRLQPGIADVIGSQAPEPTAEVTRRVLITGATGFLGRFLCLEWLERVAPLGGTVVCIVRARDEATALSRMRATFAGDDELARRFAGLEQCLEVLVGDIGEQRLGVDNATWQRLAEQIDRIVHPGALVNHVLRYEDLFGPNVIGTAELVTLALNSRIKPIDFVSSMAVVPYLDKSGSVDEGTPLAAAIEIKDRYGAHYGASKWAAESALHSAHARFGLPVTIFRGDMMLPHRHYRRQVNAPDVFVRLIQSLVFTGLAPQSFYATSDETRPRAHYDGLPVDFIASAIVAVAASCAGGLETFHVVNPHEDDGISLDTVVEWIAATGYPLLRLDSYAEWLRRFESALKSLPHDQRQRSSLSVIDSLRRPATPQPRPIGCDRFVDAVRRAGPEPEIPHLSAEFIAKCIGDLVQLDLIPRPGSRVPPPDAHCS